jgi:hypothetical protein
VPATNDNAFTYNGLSVYLWASSARTTIAAAAPSATPAQSKTPRLPAILGAPQMVSVLTSLRNCARGLRAPL